eukprot:TRINITY_DN14668_c0_g1_i1.p1 TRINITY_DN14668_c0_g1~~TRINITY_DN14668_c0_g1_i1.p1  ORF type:complete len:345 (+),score=40.96 TRINITY_DN14668_c0_g1_i1:83-1117(+)
MASIEIDYHHDSPRFDPETQRDAMLQYLNDFGYVVVAGVATPSEVAQAKDLLWQFLEGLGYGIERSDPSTWTTWPGIPQYGIFNADGIGNSDLLWFVRCLPRVRAAFEALWRTNQLLTSYDGCGTFRPAAYDIDWKSRGGWYHVDQNASKKPNLECVQGLVTLFDGNEKTGNLVVLPASHKRFRVLKKLGRSGDFVRLPAEHELLQQIRPRLVKAKAGDLILWDSRTVHCNTPALKDPVHKAGTPWELQRAVCYVCMTPLSKVPTGPERALFLKVREKGYNSWHTTNHWPHEYHRVSESMLPPRQLNDAAPERRWLVLGEAPTGSVPYDDGPAYHDHYDGPADA